MAEHPAATPASDAPQTLEGHFVLHDAYAVMWPYWLAQAPQERSAIITEAVGWLQDETGVGQLHSALYSLLGQKGDLMLIHYRKNVDALNRTERSFKRLRLFQFLKPVYSYFSVIEASLNEATAIAQHKITDRGLAPGSAEYAEALEVEMTAQRKALESRVFRFIPENRYLCFYPMSKRRGDKHNWYALRPEERRGLMRGHGRIGHKYHREVVQVIGGSIGFDDWEWGVSLHADQPLVFKKLISEMRFDPASSLYAEFGPFWFGIRQQPDDLAVLFAGGLA